MPEMLWLAKNGLEFTGSAEDLVRLRAEFESQHLIHLPGFLEPQLLGLIQDALSRTVFQAKHQVTGTELRTVDTTSYYALELLMNSPQLLRIFRQVTGHDNIACFNGRIYRRLPSPEYDQHWHTDVAEDGRLVALTINLSSGIYDGGALQIRSARSRQVLCEAANTGFGDALIFKLDPELEHRITPIIGEVPKTAMAGWFKSKPEARSLFARGVSPGAITDEA